MLIKYFLSENAARSCELRLWTILSEDTEEISHHTPLNCRLVTSDSALRRKLTRQRCEDSCSPVISDRQKRPGSARGFPWPKEAKTPHVPLKFSPNDEYEKVSCTGFEKSNHRLYQTMTTHERVRTRAGGWARASAHTVKPTF